MGKREKDETIARYQRRKNKAEEALENSLEAQRNSENPEQWDSQIQFGRDMIAKYEQVIEDLTAWELYD